MTKHRYNFKGRVTDACYVLIKEWLCFESPRPSFATIACRLNIAKSTVLYWSKSRIPPSECLHPGRPPTDYSSIRDKILSIATKRVVRVGVKISPIRKQRRLRKILVYEFPTVAVITQEYNRQCSCRLSLWQVRRHLKALDFKWKKKCRGPFLSDEAKVKRVMFARDMLKRGVPKCLLFSDESIFDTDDHTLFQWVKPGEVADVKHYTQGGATVHVWGFIGVGVRGLVVLDEGARVTSDHYVDHCLKPNKKALKNHVFVQDNARCHTASNTMIWIKEAGIATVDWPAMSPDLNPIENVWGILKRRVTQRGAYGREELVQCIKEEYAAIETATLDKLVNGFGERLKSCVKNVGGVVR